MEDQQPTLDELLEHVDVSNEWYKVGIQLKLDSDSLSKIDSEQKDVSMKLCKMYELWLSRTPNASRKQLLDVLKLKSIGKNTLASQYHKEICKRKGFIILSILFITIIIASIHQVQPRPSAWQPDDNQINCLTREDFGSTGSTCD